MVNLMGEEQKMGSTKIERFISVMLGQIFLANRQNSKDVIENWTL